MKETVVLSFLVELTLLMTVSSHEAVNPLTDNTGSLHPHHHQQQVRHQQQQQQPHHHQSAHGGIDRNAVHNQE